MKRQTNAQNVYMAMSLLEKAAVMIEEAKADLSSQTGELSAAHEQVEAACQELLEAVKKAKGNYNAALEG